MANGDQTATHQDIEQFRYEIRHRSDDLRATLREFQAEVVELFARYTQTTDVKPKETEVSDIGLRQRLTVVEERLLAVEKRLNFPPAA